MTDTPTATVPATQPADLGGKLVQDVETGVASATVDAVSALDQWLATHIQNSPLAANGPLFGLVGTVFNALRALIA